MPADCICQRPWAIYSRVPISNLQLPTYEWEGPYARDRLAELPKIPMDSRLPPGAKS